MSITDKKGINVTSGFKLISGQPIDARFVVDNETELQSIVTNGAVYEGLHVWVKSLGKEKVWNGTKFTEIVVNGGDTSEPTGGTSEAIVQVDKLPYIVEGTTVPNSGTVEKIYINKSLQYDKIKEIFDSLDYITLDGFGTIYVPFFDNSDFTAGNGLIILKQENGNYILTKQTAGVLKDIFDLDITNSTILWWTENIDNDFISFSSTNIIDLLAPHVGMTLQNEKIKDLLSITPFENWGDVNDKVVYKVQGGGSNYSEPKYYILDKNSETVFELTSQNGQVSYTSLIADGYPIGELIINNEIHTIRSIPIIVKTLIDNGVEQYVELSNEEVLQILNNYTTGIIIYDERITPVKRYLYTFDYVSSPSSSPKLVYSSNNNYQLTIDVNYINNKGTIIYNEPITKNDVDNAIANAITRALNTNY